MNQNDDSLPMNAPSVNYLKVPSLSQRRSVNYMNHFLLNTSNFLNNFAAVSEDRLSKQLLEMQKLEVAINILDAKLNSVPGLNEIATPAAATSGEPTPQANTSEEPTPQANPGTSTAAAPEAQAPPAPQPAEESPSPAAKNVTTAKEDPRYAKYFKMVAFGVPKVAIEGKMRIDGLDPSFLNTPDAPMPDAPVGDGDDDESDNESQSLSSGDDFSD